MKFSETTKRIIFLKTIVTQILIQMKKCWQIIILTLMKLNNFRFFKDLVIFLKNLNQKIHNQRKFINLVNYQMIA